MAMIEDIPEATREITQPTTRTSSGLPKLLLIGSLLLAAIAGGSFWLINRPQGEITGTKTTPKPTKVTEPETPGKKPEVTDSVTTNEPQTNQSQASEPSIQDVENILGHLPYKQADPSDLVAITRDGRIRLRKSAANKFRQMEAAARTQGISLAVISGFRTQETQDSLFFDIKEQRVQGASKRAEVSAPPGYSEHHTGYAIDLGDGNVPATHLSEKFENTPAFAWLQNNAPKYSFELSFPRNNPQGISYEPWHWRFVGDRDSLETFYKARELKSSQ